MGTFKFTVWEPVGDIDVEADSEDEAREKVEEYGYQDEQAEDEGISFDPFNDGQEWELKRKK